MQWCRAAAVRASVAAILGAAVVAAGALLAAAGDVPCTEQLGEGPVEADRLPNVIEQIGSWWQTEPPACTARSPSRDGRG